MWYASWLRGVWVGNGHRTEASLFAPPVDCSGCGLEVGIGNLNSKLIIESLALDSVVT
jgi:hypothetical protein